VFLTLSGTVERADAARLRPHHRRARSWYINQGSRLSCHDSTPSLFHSQLKTALGGSCFSVGILLSKKLLDIAGQDAIATADFMRP
jgi:hypothetical protein